jgi:hypothetical protein
MQRDNVTYKHGGIWEVRCRVCGTPIRSMVADDTHRETKKVNGQTVVFERLVLACLPNYREVLMDCGGGPGDNFVASGHVACLCDQHASELTTEQAQAIHDLDMAELKIDTKRAVNHIVAVDLLIEEGVVR